MLQHKTVQKLSSITGGDITYPSPDLEFLICELVNHDTQNFYPQEF